MEFSKKNQSLLENLLYNQILTNLQESSEISEDSSLSLSKSVDKVNALIKNKRFKPPYAIMIVSRETGIPTSDISKEMNNRKQPKKNSIEFPKHQEIKKLEFKQEKLFNEKELIKKIENSVYKHLNEAARARDIPDIYPSLLERLEKIPEDQKRNIFIHFTNPFKDTAGQKITQLGLNYNNSDEYDNVFGIYAYPAETIKNEISSSNFRTDAEHYFILKAKENASIS